MAQVCCYLLAAAHRIKNEQFNIHKMTELELYKFITDANIEWHRENNEGEEDVIIMPYIFNLEDFCKLVKNYDNDGQGLQMRLMSGNYVAIWMKDLCEYFGVEMNNVFKGKSYDE